jgi:hypothetical protein
MSPCSPRWTTPVTSWPSGRSPTRATRSPPSGPLLDSVDLTGTVITAEALQTQHAHGTYLRERGAHYIARVKANHPGLFDRIRRPPWREITLDHYDRTRAHHRLEIRRLKTAVFAHLDYPDARQDLQVVRWRKDFTTGKLTIARVYLITSLPPGAATGAPARRLDQRALEDRKSSACTTAARSARTTPKSMPAISRASWQACATSPSASTVRTATPTSPPPYVIPLATGEGP